MPEKVYSIATQIVRTLFHAGYTAYFAGGWVRDLLLGIQTDEIDIATSAPPDHIMELFPKTIPVGLAFGVVIIVINNIQFEVSTFRKDHPYHDGRHPDGVDFSTPEKDALRRDFTINGMFYDPINEELYDYVGGQNDLKKCLIRAIGNPIERFQEDKLRLIRAIRFAARFSFSIEKETSKAISEQANTLFPSVSMERIWQEFNKMASFPHFDRAITMMHRFGLLQTIFPDLKNQSIEEIEKLVAPFSDFPENCPTICYLLQLFPSYILQQKIDLCRYLKTSNENIKLATFLSQSEALMNDMENESAVLAHFYAHPSSELILQIEGAKHPSSERIPFYFKHENRRKELKAHIERIQLKRPLVNAEMLQAQGIPPGKEMGMLLQAAEKIVINENISDPIQVIEMLKKSPFWP